MLALGGCRAGAVAQASAPDAFATPTATTIDLATHVLNRCTFGPAPGDRAELLGGVTATDDDAQAARVDRWLRRQLDADSIEDGRCDAALRRFGGVRAPLAELFELKQPVLRAELEGSTLVRAAISDRQLHEVMVRFWSDHFNIDLGKGECAWLKAADDRDVIRAHALGRFGDLLAASALSPAMLTYLDGRLNRRAGAAERPNENYARELLELHTLGVHGGYGQDDVMAVARCLTGFTVRARDGFGKGRVEFHPEWHDDGAKLVLGHHIPSGGGRADLDRVLAIVSHHPSTARHIASKLCRNFIGDAPPAAAVAEVAQAFLGSGGDIRVTLYRLFGLAAFRDPATRGARLKRPFRLLVSALRATGAITDGGPALTAYLVAMGQAPFSFPTPDGYPIESSAWTDTLLWRFRFASDLAAGRIAGTQLDAADLARRAGGTLGLACHLLGRLPCGPERDAIARLAAPETRLGLLLASPGFQRH